MRKEFFKQLYVQMQKNDSIWVLSGDLGYGGFDKIMADFPHRFINCGAAEQAMLDVAIGLSLAGKIVFVYSISPFLILRPFEAIKSYINGEKINVKLIGSGQTEQCYGHEGPSHYSADIAPFLQLLPNIKKYYPTDKEFIPKIVQDMVDSSRPSVMLLKQK